MKTLKRVQASLDDEIKNFLKTAQLTEKLSDIDTYSKIKRLGNPLARKIEQTIPTLDDEEYKKDLSDLLIEMKEKNYID